MTKQTEVFDYSDQFLPNEDGTTQVEEWPSCLPDDDYPKRPVPSHPSCNGKDKHLQNGIKRARGVLHEREQTLNKTASSMNTFNKSAFGTGLFVASLGCPVIGLTIAAVSVGMQFLNWRTKKTADTQFAETYNALDVCANAKADHIDKANAYVTLKKAAKHVRYWENSQYILTTIVKFAVAEIATAVNVFMAIFDAKDSFDKQLNPPKTSSKVLTGAVGEIHKGLCLTLHKCENIKTPTPN